MKDSNVKRKSFLIVCNVLLALLLLLTTAVTITLAVQQFNMNVGGNITFNATEVQATISAGQVENGTVADSASKMQQIVLTPGTDGATEKATWTGLVITFDGLNDVTISFTVTNDHTEKDLQMTLATQSTTANNMTMTATVDGTDVATASPVTIGKSGSADNSVDCVITFHLSNNTKSASITNFAFTCGLKHVEG